MPATAVRPKTTQKAAFKGRRERETNGGRRSWADVIPGVVDDFAVPHLGTLGIGLGGWALHERLTDPVSRWIVMVTMAVGFLGVLPWVVWRYAEARKSYQRAHAMVTPVLVGLGLLGWVIVGYTPRWAILYGSIGTLLALTWNVRRAEVIRGDGDDGNDGGWAEVLGLVGSSVSLKENTNVRVRFGWTGVNGQTFKDLTNSLPRIEGAARALRGAGRAIPGQRANQGDVILVKKDVLKKPPTDPTKWDGSRFSFADGIEIALGENGSTISLMLAGSETFGASHLQVMGMTRSGKSHLFRLCAQKWSRTNDTVLWVIDVIKGAQTLSPVLSAIDWLAPTKGEATAMLTALRGTQTSPGIIKARGDYLGARGLDDWVPGCGIPALVVWVEEAAQLGLGTLFTRVVETGLSVGVFIVSSMQRASHDNLPTSARAQFGSAVCFGVQSSTDSGFVLPDEVNDVAIADQWKGRFKGKCYVDGPNIDDEMKGSPARTFNTNPDKIDMEVQANAPGMCRLDEITAQAAGEAYLTRDHRSPVLSGTCPSDPKVDRPKRRAQVGTPSVTTLSKIRSIETRSDGGAIVTLEEDEMEDDPRDTSDQDDEAQEDNLVNDGDQDDPLDEEPPLPEAYPGSNDDLSEIDPRVPLPRPKEDVVFVVPSAVVEPLRGQARHEAWEATLAEVAAEGERLSDGSIVITMEQILDAWYDDPDVGRVRGISESTRPWIYERLKSLRQEGLCSWFEAEPGQPSRGRYVLSGSHDWTHPHVPITEGELGDDQDDAQPMADIAVPDHPAPL